MSKRKTTQSDLIDVQKGKHMRIKNTDNQIPDSHYAILRDRYLSLFVKSMAGRSREDDRYLNIIKPILDSQGIKENTSGSLCVEMFVLGVEAGIDYLYHSEREFVV